MAAHLRYLENNMNRSGQFDRHNKLESTEMKKRIDKQSRLRYGKRASSTKRSSVESDSRPQELMTPHEWKSMLHNIENQAAPAEIRARPPSSAELDRADEELWERLSSTRWIKERPSESAANKNTATQQQPIN